MEKGNKKSPWKVVAVFGLIFTFIGMVLIAGTLYAQWRNFTSIGVYQFKTTGEIITKQEKESRRLSNSRHNQLVAVTNKYVVYRSVDGQYRFEQKIKPERWGSMSHNMKNGTVYTLEREVFIDRGSEVNIREPNIEQTPLATRYMTFFFIFVAPGGGLCLLALWQLSRRR